ncbi:unnamed protein product [Tilletia controversa]|uniref:FAD/NAD(P)-binding domain-containing protein n=3 Tax=Tilletia TaxID=13289 RepID=A0A8X7N2A6_9BASI|nr:hypothetical protein CF336_g216 [Tilletia laevis]KAE8205863.1 hypothetical protein CF328_g239 [Tilletia controversa]KAE8264155.1 hypothetical protein A4X03_0g1144 [Tilletia caries]KAE8208910.1 hypothetical protein CF335_g51 [Tilletia laevis]KAE8255967.1 hypothetical protein A4X06_0g145 [Tilletia controversa]
MALTLPAAQAALARSIARPSAFGTPSSNFLTARNQRQARSASTSASTPPPKRRVVILGSGWGGYNLARELDKTKNEVTIVSPSTNFAFTPLLASVCVGALDYRSAIEPVREIRDANFLHSWVDSVDVQNRTLTLVPAYPRALGQDRFAETRGGFNTAFVRPAHRRPVETAEGDALDLVSPGGGSGNRQQQTGAGSSTGAFQATQTNSAQSTLSSADLSSEGGDAALLASDAAAGRLASHDSYGPSETWASQERGREFKIDYDVLVLAVGSFNRTFKLKGVKSHAWFLKDIQNARSIRFRLFECLEQASALHLNDMERSRLLQWVIVGGGPTGSEFAAELVDLKEDIKRLYPKLAPLIKITLLDSAPGILNTFHDNLASYARAKFARDGIDVRLNQTVKEVLKGRIVLQSGEKEAAKEEIVPFSLLVWSTGICTNPLIKKLGGQSAKPDVNFLGTSAAEQGWATMAIHERTGQILIDDHLRVLAPVQDNKMSKKAEEEEESAEEVELGVPSDHKAGAKQDPDVIPGVFAIGDCSALRSGILPATAQVAAQQAKHLAKILNKLPALSPGHQAEQASLPADQSLSQITKLSTFKFQNRGIMASLGSGRAIVQLPPIPEGSKTERDISGKPAWLAWRSAYTMMSLSWRNKVAVPLNWFMTAIFGRDISRF